LFFFVVDYLPAATDFSLLKMTENELQQMIMLDIKTIELKLRKKNPPLSCSYVTIFCFIPILYYFNCIVHCDHESIVGQ